MKGNITTTKDCICYNFIVLPIAIATSFALIFSVLLLAVNYSSLSYCISNPKEMGDHFDAILPGLLLLGAFLLLLFVYLFLWRLTISPVDKKFKKTIRVGAKIDVDISRVEEMHRVNDTKTPLYFGFVKVDEYTGVTSGIKKTICSKTAAVTSVEKRGFEIEIDGKKQFVKFLELFGRKIAITESGGIDIVKNDIVKMDISR